jgi:hypothetical protein
MALRLPKPLPMCLGCMTKLQLVAAELTCASLMSPERQLLTKLHPGPRWHPSKASKAWWPEWSQLCHDASSAWRALL